VFGADADHEDARATAHGRDGFEQFLLIADRAVGQEHNLTEGVGVAIGVVSQRRAHRRHHFGTAGRLQCIHE
jgi:hypothetical protein